MSLLFVSDNKAVIAIEGNRCSVKYADGMKKIIPIETLESITIMGHAQITTQCIQECLKRGIPVAYFSKGGSYFGRLQSTGHMNAERQRKQSALYETAFALDISKSIVRAKLKNQLVVLRRYEKSRGIPLDEAVKMLHICRDKVEYCTTIPEVMGYGFRIQKSAFEAVITKKKYKELIERLPAYVSSEDSIRVYKIVGKGQVVSFGRSMENETEDVVVI